MAHDRGLKDVAEKLEAELAHIPVNEVLEASCSFCGWQDDIKHGPSLRTAAKKEAGRRHDSLKTDCAGNFRFR